MQRREKIRGAFEYSDVCVYACVRVCVYTSKVAREWGGARKVFKINLFKIRYVDLGHRVFHVKQSHEFPNTSAATHLQREIFESPSILTSVATHFHKYFTRLVVKKRFSIIIFETDLSEFRYE